ncbi:MAG: dihydrodipicolinate reductase [Planctomycetota bacterium]|nr:dihydrodipicolinate reductase [Planctomycetota bacterium]
MYRLLHVGVGPLGQRIIAELIDRGLARVLTPVDSSPALAGKPLSEFVPAAEHGVRVLGSVEEVHDWHHVDAAIVATSSDLRQCMDTFRALLKRGKAIVSTCEELVYPWLRHLAIAEELDALAKQHGGRLLGTGVNPGFLMDTLPAVLTGVCRSVRSVKCSRIQDASSRRVPFQKKIGAGLTDEQFAGRVADGSLRHVGLGESLHFIAHYTGLKIERWEEDIAPVKATRDLTSALGPISRGLCAGVRQTARGYADERVVVELEFQAAIGQTDPHDRITIDADPPIDAVLHGGVHGDLATSAIVCNAIPRLMGAAPGLHTMATIPPVVHAHG